MKTTTISKEEGYSGENEKWLEINKKISIRRDDNLVYLFRRTLISIGDFFSIKYHKILQSDDVCSHDHPWAFITIILRGGYYEWTPISQKDKGIYIGNRVAIDGVLEVCNYHPSGSILFRPAKWRHQLELNKSLENSTQLVAAKTLIFTFKVLRDWGFFTKFGWIYWENYNKKRDC